MISFVLLICTKMELPTHPLLSLVECNANGLKLLLKNYIDFTVEQQFGQLKSSIVTMIATGQIGPQQRHDGTAFGTTLPPPTQTNTEQSSAQCLHEYSNDQLTSTLEHQNIMQNEVSLSNAINTDKPMIKQEFDDEDGDGEEVGDDNVTHSENCEKGICNSVRENYDDDANIRHMLHVLITYVNAALESNQMNQPIITNDIFSNPNIAINTEPMINQKCLEILPITTQSNNAASKDISIDEPIDGQNESIPTDQFDDNDDSNDDYYDDIENEHLNQSNCDDCAYGVCDLDHENNNNNHLNSYGPFETQNVDVAQEDNQINQSISNVFDETTENANNELQVNDESDQLHNVRRLNEQNSKKKTRHLIKSSTFQDARSVTESSTPSTGGVRSSTRKRIQTKVFGDDQSNDDVISPKSEKRKSVQSSKSRKRVKRKKIENADADIDDEDEDNDNQEVKGQVVILELECTEPDCGQTASSRALLREHMRNHHHKSLYYHLENNVQFNDSGKTGYQCTYTNCNVTSKTRHWFTQHWSRYHQPGKYKCPTCHFMANLHYKVRNHFKATHGSHECTHNGCGEMFPSMSDLKRHKRVHSSERAYKCTWKKCQLSFKHIGAAVQHVRAKHFNLPMSTKEQIELNIIDSRNAHDYIHKIEHLL